MSSREIKLVTRLGRLESITGSGDQISFKFTMHRTTKAGTHEAYTVEASACRWSVRQILDQLKAMHVRDHERIQGELARIKAEINGLTP